MAGGDGAGLPRSTVLVSFGTIVLIGALAFFVVSWSNARTQAATLSGELAAVEATLQEKQEEIAPERRKLETLQTQTDLFARGKMCVLNASSDQKVTIRKLAIVYLDDAGGFQTFNSDTAGGVQWTIEPGHREHLDYPRGGWDGSVTYFAMWYSVGGNEFPMAEAWPLDPEHCARMRV